MSLQTQIPSSMSRHAPSRTHRLIAFLAMGGIYFFSYFLRAGVPGTIFNEIQSDLALSASAVANLGSMFLLIYACMQLFVGMAADRFGGSRTLLFGGVFMGAGAVLFPLSHSPGMLYLTRALTGFGASFMYLSMVKEVDLLFAPRHFPVMIGLTLFCGYSGGMAGMLPFERLVHAFGWRPTLLAVGVLILVCLVVAHRVLRGIGTPLRHPTAGALRPLWGILSNPRAFPSMLCGIINFPIYFVIQTTLGKKFLEDVSGLSSAHAATFTMVMMLVSAGLSLSGGFLPGWCGQRRKPILVAASVCILAAIVLLLIALHVTAPGWVFLLGYILLAIPSGAGPAGISTMKELNRPDSVALSIAVINALSYAGVAVLTAVVGVILDAFRARAVVTQAGAIVYPGAAYSAVLLLLAALAAISVLSSLRIPETRGVGMRLDPPVALP